MSHSISVIVFKKEESKIDLSKIVHVEGPQGFIFTPESLYEEGDDNKFEKMARRISSGPVAYLSTDYFGGFGEQSAELFEGKDDNPYSKEFIDSNSIDTVLKLMGLKCEKDKDEFDTLGLGGYRSYEDFYPPKEIDPFEEYRYQETLSREQASVFPDWCNELYHYKGRNQWTHGSGGNEKNYSTDDLLTIFLSQGGKLK